MAQKFTTLVAGKPVLKEASTTSAGAADAGKIPALGTGGKLDQSMMPVGIGANTISAPASEALTAGKLVNLFSNAGALGARLADNTNGRMAHGYVIEAVASGATATVYPLDGINASVSGLTPGSEYYLGTAGGVITPALDETVAGNAGYTSQLIGIAKSATELVTNDSPAYTL